MKLLNKLFILTATAIAISSCQEIYWIQSHMIKHHRAVCGVMKTFVLWE